MQPSLEEQSQKLKKKAYLIIDNFVPPETVAHIRNSAEAYAQKQQLPTIERTFKGRSLRYKVIDGNGIRTAFPEVVGLYQEIQKYIEELYKTPLIPMVNTLANLNINITEPGGEYRWHYDRNEVTALLYLNDVQGGELELYPNYRWRLPQAVPSAGQRLLDGVFLLMSQFKKPVSVQPKAGRLVVMRGEYCLHSVRPVIGKKVRYNVVLSYDKPEAQHQKSQTENLDKYLFSAEKVSEKDPNYQR